jgi:hypothetical protein
MVAEGPGNAPAEAGDFVLATYREIAHHFRLGGPKAARTKVKRAGWAHDPPNHPSDPLRIRVPRDPWDQAGEVPTPQRRETPGTKSRDPRPHGRETPGIKHFEAVLSTLEEQLERERGRADRAESRADASETRIRELMTELDAAREKDARLREERAAAISKAAAAEAQLDDAKAEARKEGEGRAKLQARLELVQADNEKLRADAVRAGQVDRATARPGLLQRLLGRKRE